MYITYFPYYTLIYKTTAHAHLINNSANLLWLFLLAVFYYTIMPNILLVTSHYAVIVPNNTEVLCEIY